MLLAQWGVYNWGSGEEFQFGLTRQFIRLGASGDDAISQLHFTAYYPPTDTLRSVKRDDRWCEKPTDVASFEHFIRSSAAFNAVVALLPTRIEIRWERV